VGQKTHPYGFRLGYNNTWRSRWYADGVEYANLLHEDLQLRQELLERLENAAVSAIDIERTASKLRVNILSGRPGIIIGRKGAEVDKLRDDLMRRYGQDIHINIQEIQRPEIDAHLIGSSSGGSRSGGPCAGRSRMLFALAPRGSRSVAPGVSTALRSRAPSGTSRDVCRSIP